jgi:hypothetical protein
MVDELVTGLFDDASMFPPAAVRPDRAVAGHARHRLSWYEDFVGPLVTTDSRLLAVDEHVQRLGVPPVAVAAVVPGGPAAVSAVQATLARCPALRLAAVEFPIGRYGGRAAARAAAPFVERGVAVYVEIPVRHVTERHVHDLRAAGLHLKLRTGGTTLDAFSTEDELAGPIVLCAAEMLRFKCTAGLHSGVRHRDAHNGFEHHGFLNIALATLCATGTANAAAVAAVLAERDPAVVAERVRQLDLGDVKAIRTVFGSLGTCSVTEPIDDLISLGLVRAG